MITIPCGKFPWEGAGVQTVTQLQRGSCTDVMTLELGLAYENPQLCVKLI